MGAYLAKPKTEKISDSSENGRLRYGVSCMQGWRVTMEVKIITKLILQCKTQVKQIVFVSLFNPSTPAFQRKNMHMLFGKGLER